MRFALLLTLAAPAAALAQTPAAPTRDCTLPPATVADLLTGRLGGLSARIRTSSVRAELPCVVEDRYDEEGLVALGVPDENGNERRLMTFSPTYGWSVREGFGGTLRPAVFGLSLMRARQVLENNGMTYFGTLGEGGSSWQFRAPYGCLVLEGDDEGGVVGASASSVPCAHPND